MSGMTEDEVKTVRWVEWVLAPILVVSVLALGRCTASAQDELIILQKDVAQITTANGETKAAIKQIEKDANDTKVSIGKIEANQENFKAQIGTMQSTQEETNRLLRDLLR